MRGMAGEAAPLFSARRLLQRLGRRRLAGCDLLGGQAAVGARRLRRLGGGRRVGGGLVGLEANARAHLHAFAGLWGTLASVM